MRSTLAVLVLALLSGPALADTIDFETYGGSAQDSVGTIGIASFSNAIYADVGGTRDGFVNHAGQNDTMVGTDADLVGDWFITDPLVSGDFGGDGGPIVIDFSTAVTYVSLYILDVNYDNTEQVTVEIWSGGSLVDSVVFTEDTPPSGSVAGDGLATLVAFGNSSAIDQLTIDVYQTDSDHGGRYGFGVDEISFTPVPLPAAVWAGLGLLGLLGLGHKIRRR